MRILLALNKTYYDIPDTGHWYTFEPLRELGHEVFWYDTVDPEVRDFSKVVEKFKPDLIWCCFTGNRKIAPYEPFEEIHAETTSGRTKTFHWFADCTWRFDAKPMGSSQACHSFTACSTPEPEYVQKYKEMGYENILLATWHANSKYYSPKPYSEKEIQLSLVGNLSETRKKFFDALAYLDFNTLDKEKDKMLPIEMPPRALTVEEMFAYHSNTKIGINLARNDNDPRKKTQMKQRIFEIAAGGGLIFTEYHKAMEGFFEEDREMITFKTPEEFLSKMRFLLKNESFAAKIAAAGHKRFLAEHDSKIRLKKLLKELKEL